MKKLLSLIAIIVDFECRKAHVFVLYKKNLDWPRTQRKES